MEGEICQHHKYGYCRFKSECNKIHFSSECTDLEGCKNSKGCQKRHPKRCKRYASGTCRFENGCAYKHQKPTTNEDPEQKKLKEKVQVMEKVLHAMTRKVLILETEVERLKKKSSKNEIIENEDELAEDVIVKEVQKEVIDESSSSSHNDIKDNCSTPKEDQEEVKKVKTKSELLNCKECNYSCKKEKSLKNHMLTKHENHQCKECHENFQNFMQLLKHVAKNHNKEVGEKSEEDEVMNDQVVKVHNHLEEVDTLVFKESMVN